MSVRFDPFRSFEGLSKKMNQAVNELEKGFSVEMGSFSPRVDIIEDDKKLLIQIEVPGIQKEHIKLKIDKDNVLLISGEKKTCDPETCDCKSYIRSERTFGNFTRSFMLPENIDVGNIDAKYENGVLYLELIKIDPELPDEIKIEIK